MYLAKNKKGEWFIQYSFVNWKGERERTTKRGFKTKREAQEWYNRFMALQKNEFCMLFEDFVNEIYLPDMKSRLREHTIIQKGYVINLKILPYFGNKKISEITVSDIRKWEKSLIDEGYAPTYLRSIYAQLSAIFNYAMKYYDLKSNPCKKAGSMGKNEYYDAAEPPVRCGVSHLSGPTEPLYKLTILPVMGQAHRPLSWKCPWKDPHIRYQFYMSRRIYDP